MDISSHASPRSFPNPQTSAPLALSDFIAQVVPCSEATGSTDEPAMSRSAMRPSGSADEPKRAPAQDETRVKTPQQPPHEIRPQETQTPPPTQEEDSPPPTDWLATRQQLLPRRNQGKKADWIRGWSQAVSSHGDETYCACSESIENGMANHRGRKAKTSIQLADNVRAILQRASSPSSSGKSKPAAAPPTPETAREVCPYCSRPPSPPPSSTAGARGNSSSRASSMLHSPGNAARAISKRFGELLMRMRRLSSSPRASECAAATAWRIGRRRGIYGSNSSSSSSSSDGIIWPENCQPPWATTRPGQSRCLARPASQPLSAPVQGTGLGFPWTPRKSRGLMMMGGRRKKKRRKAQPLHEGGYFARRSRSWGRIWPDITIKSTGARRRFEVPLSPPSTSSSSSLSDLAGVLDSSGDPARPGLSRSMSRLQRAAALLQRATAKSKD
ncbi:hypothetical protein VTH82DRAFT_3534 [Thermothelomyces myriococcoides]